MLAYTIRRVLLAIPVMLMVATAVFLLLRLTPGDPAGIILGPEATEERRLALRREQRDDDQQHHDAAADRDVLLPRHRMQHPPPERAPSAERGTRSSLPATSPTRCLLRPPGPPRLLFTRHPLPPARRSSCPPFSTRKRVPVPRSAFRAPRSLRRGGCAGRPPRRAGRPPG